MGARNKETSHGINKGAAILGAALALLVGFYLGFTVHGMLGDSKDKSSPQMPPQATAPAAPAAPGNPAMADRIKAVEKQTQLEPANTAAWVQLGNLYFDTGQADKAVTAYTKALTLDPRQPDVLTDQGVMLRQLGQFDKAIECFDKAIAIKPDHVIAHFNKSVVLEHDKHDKAGALAALQALAAKNPNAALPGGRTVSQAIAELSAN